MRPSTVASVPVLCTARRPAGHCVPGDEEPAWELFRNREEIERLMTDVIRAWVQAKLGVAIRATEDAVPEDLNHAGIGPAAAVNRNETLEA